MGWAASVLVATTALLLVALLAQTGGTFVYVLDDPAIHLTVARRLAHDGTWGVVPGEFQAASSSPLWTVLLAPTQLLVRGRAGEWAPLVLNLLAGLGIVRLLGPDLHRALRGGPGRDRAGATRWAGDPGAGRDADGAGRSRGLDTVVLPLALAGVVIGLLFLPGLVFFGMEHTLHTALVLATVLAVERRWVRPGPADQPPAGRVASVDAHPVVELAGTGELDPEPLADPPGPARRHASASASGSPGAGPLGPSTARGGGPPVETAGWSDRPPAWMPFVLLALATWARGESAVVAVGLAVGLLVARTAGVPGRALGAGGRRGGSRWLPPRLGIGPARGSWRSWVLVSAGLGLAVAVALGSVAGLNLAFGQGALPNSVLVKTFGDRGDSRRTLAAAWDRLTTDPLLLTLFLVALAVVALAAVGRERRASGPVPAPALWPALFPAVVMVVATVLHVELGAVDRSLRYEAYLVGLGVLVVLRALPDAHAWLGQRAPALAARIGAAGLVVLLVPAAALQVHDTVTVPDQAQVLWEQRYHVARFLDAAYDTEPVAIGELGYIALYHDGPLTDVYGLGDHEVLEATLDDRKDAAYWRELQARRGFPVVVAYDFSLGGQAPPEWFPVASWRSPDAFYPVTLFWATTPAEVEPLRRHLEAFEPRLPDDVEVTYNDLAAVAAQSQLDRP